MGLRGKAKEMLGRAQPCSLLSKEKSVSGLGRDFNGKRRLRGEPIANPGGGMENDGGGGCAGGRWGALGVWCAPCKLASPQTQTGHQETETHRDTRPTINGPCSNPQRAKMTLRSNGVRMGVIPVR